MLIFHSLPLQELFKRLGASPQGLSGTEATSRLRRFGKNQLQEEKPSLFKILIRQFVNPLILILFVASFISLSIGKITDFFVIDLIVVLNGLIGFLQEHKAEKSIAALKKLTESRNKVMRDGQLILLPSSEIVPGDYIVLHEGELVTADIRLVESHGLMIDESMLTGESTPVIKDHTAHVLEKASVFELKNILLTGTVVVRGTGHGIVVNTAAQTYLASLAKEAKASVPPTPLAKAIGFFAKRYVVLLVLLCLIMGIVGYFQDRSMIDLGYILLAMIVSAVPEGLPIVITLVLGIGALALSKRKALIRSLPAVETLGSVTIIASDKTGTITKGKLEVAKVYSDDLKNLKKIAALCNDAHGKTGDPLDVALARWVEHFDEIREAAPRKWSYSFDTRLMLMATVNEIEGKEVLCIKGAFEALKEKVESEEDVKPMEKAFNAFLEQGLRVLALGMGTWKGGEDPLSWKIRLVGLIGFIDLPKPGVKEAVESARKAGIHVMMITGDHPRTAYAIAYEVGIASNENRCLTGKEIETLNDERAFQALKKATVLARILPEHKYRVVKILQKGKELVAMTGDGVNDVPALRAADIGIAMGSGTEAAKDASDMVITDNNLKVIVNAIHNARVIADNIRKVIYYLVSTSLLEVAFIALVIFSGYPLPISAIQILWINIVAEGIQDKVFAFTKEEGNVMQRKPRAPDQQFFDIGQAAHMLYFGCGMALFMFFFYLYLLRIEEPFEVISSIIFSMIVVSQWAHGIQAQREKEPFFRRIRRSFSANPWIFCSLGVGVILQCIPLYLFPKAFNSVPLTLSQLKYPLLAFAVSFLFVELRKWIEFAFSQKFSRDFLR